jgi:hypothetical protein
VSTTGYGAWCSSADPNKAGLYSQNTGNARALEIGAGRIKIRSADASITAWGSAVSYDGGKSVHAQVPCNGASGQITFPVPGGINPRWIGINNSYVKTGSKIFFTAPRSNNVTDWLITSPGKLWVQVYQARDEAGFLQFLVIE